MAIREIGELAAEVESIQPPVERLINVAGRAGGSGATGARVGLITQVEGLIPPHTYSAVEAVTAIAGGVLSVTAKVNGLVMDRNLRSLREMAYPGAAKIPVGTPVVFWACTGGYLCDRAHYDGTYQ